jgi:hypothetical protein
MKREEFWFSLITLLLAIAIGGYVVATALFLAHRFAG